jgi:hypothetical protein
VVSLPHHKQHLPNGHQARYTAETVLRTRPKTYRKIVHLLADPNWSALQISKSCRVSEHTVRAIRKREAQDIADRKKTLAVMLANVAELGAGRMEETVGKAGCRDDAIVTGIATDKMLALGQTPVGIQIANIQMPTPEQDEARRRSHHALDEITRLLHKQEPLSEKEELLLKVQCRALEITHEVDHPRREKCSQSREDIR